MKLGCLALIGYLLSPVAPQTFTVRVDAVRVDALVTDNNRPVAGLTAKDFELRDTGVVQAISSVALEDVPLSIMLALDTSASVGGQPLRHLKEAASAAVRLLGPTDRAALLTFGDAIHLRAPWTADRAALEMGIMSSEAGGLTTLYDAAYAALTLRDTAPARTLVLLFSDGADTASWLPGANVIDVARRNDAVVYAVRLNTGLAPATGYRLDFHSGLQDRITDAPTATLLEPLLDALADETGGHVLNAERSDRLRDTFEQIVKEFRTRYLLTYTPQNVAPSGWHPLEVKVKGRRAKVTARRGYLR